MTGTTSSGTQLCIILHIILLSLHILSQNTIDNIIYPVTAHPPSDWNKIRSEKAEKWTYSYEKEKWFKEQCKVKIDKVPFAKGGMRYVFHLQDTKNPKLKYVAKTSPDFKNVGDVMH